MTRLSRYIKALVQIEEGMPWFFPIFGAILLSVLANLMTDLLKELGGIGAAVIFLVCIFALAVVMIAIYSNRVESRKQRNLEPFDKPNPTKRKGLIILVSNEPALRKAVEYHLPTLEHCWLITTPQSAGLGAKIQAEYAGRIKFHPGGIDDELDSDGCYRHVSNILYSQAKDQNLGREDLVADITGGTKPMTTALVLACLRSEPPLDMEHVPTRYAVVDGVRKATEPLAPIQIVVQQGE